LCAVLRARGLEAARGRRQRRDEALVEPDRQHVEPAQQLHRDPVAPSPRGCLRRARSTSSGRRLCASERTGGGAPGVATSTTSSPGGSAASDRRKASRRTRRARFLSTARRATLRETESPRRVCASPFSSTTTAKAPPCARRPSL